MTARFGTLLIGPREHGVVIFGARIAAALPLSAPCQWELDAATVIDGGVALGPLDVVHTHFTDQLFAARCELAAAQFVRVVDAVRRQTGADVVATLHDIPCTEDDSARFVRRAAAYATVIAACDGRVIVSSDHEADRVRAISPGCDPTVIALPITSADCITSAEAVPSRPDDAGNLTDTDVTVLGFIYPGKGHAEAIQASRHLPSHVGVTALGRAADRHGALMGQLFELSSALGRRFTVTGFLAEADLTRRLRSAAIPLAAQRDISASGSIASWLGAGRRPLVPDGPYTRELERRCPRSVVRYPPGETGLASALLSALADPASTWLDHTVVLYPSPAEVGRLLAGALQGVRQYSRR